MLCVVANFLCNAGDCLVNPCEDLSDLCGRADPCLAKAAEILCRRPFRRSVEGKSQTVGGQVDGCGYQIVNGREASLAVNIVIDNAKVFQMRVAVAERAVQCDEGEQSLHVLVDVGRPRKLAEALHD